MIRLTTWKLRTSIHQKTPLRERKDKSQPAIFATHITNQRVATIICKNTYESIRKRLINNTIENEQKYEQKFQKRSRNGP